MIWSTWRQHRPEALAGAAVLAATVAVVIVAADENAISNPLPLQTTVALTLAVLPALVGVFVGAALLTRDLEVGTHRLVWTQGTPRSRWLATKLALVFGAVLPAGALVGVLTAAVVTSTSEPVDPWAWFDQSGPAFAAYVAFALALGVALGAVVGRTYPAMALTLVVYVTVRVPVEVFLRPRYMTPLRMRLESLTTLHAPPGRYLPMWLDMVYQTRSGRTLTFQQAVQAMGPGQNDNLAAHGLVGWVYYQPGDRFWGFQGIEATIFLALAALLVGLTFYWVNRRIA
jgi:hypothetical protein